MTAPRPPSDDRTPGGKDGPPEASKDVPEPPETPGAAPDPPDEAVTPSSTALSRSKRAPTTRPARRRSPDRQVQAAWVARLQDRDEDALAEVIEAFGERLAAVVAGILRDHDAVEDVVQTTFTKAWFRIGSFRGGSGLYTWLYRVAVNAAKDYIKGRSRRPALPLDDQQAGRLPANAPHVLEGIERRELREAVRAAISSLPERYRVVLALRELEGMTYDQIAEVTGLSLGTVESRLFRARRRLRGVFDRGYDATGLRERRGREEGQQ